MLSKLVNFCFSYIDYLKTVILISGILTSSDEPFVLQTLSSLALVFALHHYKPTPLYVMDEIDAALGKSRDPFL